MNQQFDMLLADLLAVCRCHYGDRLVSLVVFGSVGRGVPGPESDLDVLLVVEDLPQGRPARVEDFRRHVENSLPGRTAQPGLTGLKPEVSPVFKTPAEAEQGSPLFLDMVEDGRILFDRGGFMEGVLARLKERMRQLGSRRVWLGNAWFWDLKPDYRPGEVFEL
jgi:predicted nucleotidyltransferase